jgi:hypothetical protein
MSKHFNPMARGAGDTDQSVSLGQAKIIATTDKAIRVILDSDGKAYWIPESVVHDDSEVFQGCDGAGELVVKAWFAEKEGLS